MMIKPWLRSHWKRRKNCEGCFERFFHSKVQPLENCFVLRALMTGHNYSLKTCCFHYLEENEKGDDSWRGYGTTEAAHSKYLVGNH